jgi:hypothetical protein
MGKMSSNSILIRRILRRLEGIEEELKDMNKKLENK